MAGPITTGHCYHCHRVPPATLLSLPQGSGTSGITRKDFVTDAGNKMLLEFEHARKVAESAANEGASARRVSRGGRGSSFRGSGSSRGGGGGSRGKRPKPGSGGSSGGAKRAREVSDSSDDD